LHSNGNRHSLTHPPHPIHKDTSIGNALRDCKRDREREHTAQYTQHTYTLTHNSNVIFLSHPLHETTLPLYTVVHFRHRCHESPKWKCARKNFIALPSLTNDKFVMKGEPNVFRFVASFQSSAASAVILRIHAYVKYLCACCVCSVLFVSVFVCVYVRLCKTRTDMYPIVLPFELYTNTIKKWEWYTIATSDCGSLRVCVCLRLSALCVC